ncbi:MAG: pantothenate synthase [Piccolia ochrophora]|nr:MAG: pantothenate synthase [Piccolia ochrophora]
MATSMRSHSSSALPFNVFRDIEPLRTYRRGLLLERKTVGLVPTMGALHAGHLSLLRRAAQENTNVFVSVYVNPTQFGINEDLDSYPKTWEADMDAIKGLDEEFAASNTKVPTAPLGRISAIFAPTTKIMYPTLPPTSAIDGHGSFVTLTPISTLLEGRSRPVFFRGVATVCMKLFNITAPDRVYFGQKDIQQTVVIRRMVQDFCIDTDVRIVPTEREPDGLALSSRNVYLGQRRRRVAVVLAAALNIAETQYAAGKRTRDEILRPALEFAHTEAEKQENLAPGKRARFTIDYISLADPDSMEEIDEVKMTRGAVLSGAIVMQPAEDVKTDEDSGLGGGTLPVRLIDNILLKPEG